jgi:hypothetical protein
MRPQVIINVTSKKGYPPTLWSRNRSMGLVITYTFKDYFTKFSGIEDGFYFMWRPEVINTIHTANLSVQRKHTFITKFLDRKEARLAAMCIFTTFTASTYVDLIE